jgi:hypothetical protein
VVPVLTYRVQASKLRGMLKQKLPKEVSEYFRKLAEAGGYPSKGGKARKAALTPEERSAIASTAAKARWAKAKKKS